MKANARNIRQLKALVDIRKNERQLARTEVFEAFAAEMRAEEVLSLVESSRDEALQDWENCRLAEEIDLGLEPAKAQHLIDQEMRVQQSGDLLSLAQDRHERNQAIWKRTDLNLKLSRKISRQAERTAGRKSDEERLAELNDQHCYRQVRT